MYITIPDITSNVGGVIKKPISNTEGMRFGILIHKLYNHINTEPRTNYKFSMTKVLKYAKRVNKPSRYCRSNILAPSLLALEGSK